MPAREPAAATRTWFSSHSKVSAPTNSKLWSLVAFIVSAASAMTGVQATLDPLVRSKTAIQRSVTGLY
jgi:hypothetical protein